jgi:predicted Zn finger-like uncharacterized protein
VLVTTCKACRARFRVTPDQLNARQGQVRCGECHAVFNGFEALERFPGDDTGARLLAARAAPALDDLPAGVAPPSPPAAPDLAAFDAPVDAPATPFPATSTPDGDFPSAESAAPPPLPDGPAAEFADVFATTAQPAMPDLPLDPPDAEAMPRATEFPPDDSPAPMSAPAPMTAHSPVPRETPSIPLSAYTLPSPPPEPPRPSRAWAWGAALAFIALAGQLTWAFRADIARRYPPARPALEAACLQLGCTVPWINEDSALKLEDSELLEVPGKPGQISLSARIRSLASAPQEYPHVELTLTDTTGQVAARKVLRPADYLGHAPLPGEVLAPGAETLVSLRLETGPLKPTGYELLLFYP